MLIYSRFDFHTVAGTALPFTCIVGGLGIGIGFLSEAFKGLIGLDATTPYTELFFLFDIQSTMTYIVFSIVRARTYCIMSCVVARAVSVIGFNTSQDRVHNLVTGIQIPSWFTKNFCSHSCLLFCLWNVTGSNCVEGPIPTPVKVYSPDWE